MTAFVYVRGLLLALVWCLSIIVLALAANSLALAVGSVWLYPNLALATAIVTHAVSTPMILLSFAKKDAFVSTVIFELSWVGCLWVLWLASAVTTTSTPVFPMSCMDYRTMFGDDVASECTQFSALEIASWMNASLLLFYSIVTFTLSILNNMRNRDDPQAPNVFFSAASSLIILNRTGGFPRGTRNLNSSSISAYKAAKPSSSTSSLSGETKTGSGVPVTVPSVAMLPGSHPYWGYSNSVSGNDSTRRKSRASIDSQLERGRSTSTVSSFTRNYVPSPLGPGGEIIAVEKPGRAILPSQSPHLTMKGSMATASAFQNLRG